MNRFSVTRFLFGCAAIALTINYAAQQSVSLDLPFAVQAARPRILVIGFFAVASYFLLVRRRRGRDQVRALLGYISFGIGVTLVMLVSRCMSF
jgi:uncharacterized membrane protein YjfL (UPF0719 family)